MKTIEEAKLIDYFYLMLLSAIWGSAFVSISFALNDSAPFLIAFGRIFLAALFLSMIAIIRKIPFRKDLASWKMFALIGFLNTAMPFYLISWGQQFITPSTTALLLAVGPFIVLIISHFVTHDEKFTIFKLIGVIFGFFGVFLLLGDDFVSGNQNSLYGKIAMLIAVIGYISAGFLIRTLSHIPILISSSSMFIASSIMMFPFVFFISYENVTVFSYSSLAIVYLAIVPTALASLLRINLVQKIGVQFMSQVSYLIPIFAIFWSWLFFNQIPEKIAFIALIFILSGLFIRKLKLKRKNK
ncbi:MAG TPA: DMT family transporter [Arcobacter sp.]|nr:DMT family transporter [Arcobacter sp.]